MATRTLTDRVIKEPTIQRVIGETVGNLTKLRSYRPDAAKKTAAVRAALEQYARRIVGMAVQRPASRPNFKDPGWQRQWANAAEAAVEAAGGKDYTTRYAAQIGRQFPRRVTADPQIIELGLYKISTYAGQAGRIMQLGLSTELLRMSPEEAVQQILRVHASVPAHRRSIALVPSPAQAGGAKPYPGSGKGQ